MPKDDFRALRKNRQNQPPPAQGIPPVTPEDVYSVPLPGRQTVEPENSQTVALSEEPMASHDLVKTSFYPTRDQLDKLDDLAAEYNRRYRRHRPKIDRQDIIRYLIDQVSIGALDNLEI